jgi:hypothetical protein
MSDRRRHYLGVVNAGKYAVSSRTALVVCAKLDGSALHENGPFPKLDVYLFGSRLSSKKSDNFLAPNGG